MIFNNWIRDIKAIIQYKSELIELKDGFWKVHKKDKIIAKYSRLIFDANLVAIETISIKVLSEIDPMFDLEPEMRIYAVPSGKLPKYSTHLKKGLSETLAFIGANGKMFDNCSLDKPRITISKIVSNLLANPDWKLWATLNEYLPLYAEADPESFLNSVQLALKNENCPFDELFKQESSGIYGRNYMVGLFWALEVLAWSDEYFARTMMILAELATHDNYNGNWVNRPINSLLTILLPWKPQTSVTSDKRISVVKAINIDFPKIARQLLLLLLNTEHQVSKGTMKPKYRKFIPDNFTNTPDNEEFEYQIKELSLIAVGLARNNMSYLMEVIEAIENIPFQAVSKILSYLSSTKLKSEEHKFLIWNKLRLLVKRHIYFKAQNWAFSDVQIKKITNVVSKLKPNNDLLLYKHLFLSNDYEYDSSALNWREQNKINEQKRSSALKKIRKTYGLAGVLKFASSVEDSSKVGFTFSSLSTLDDDLEILPKMLGSKSEKKKSFLRTFIWKKYNEGGYDFLSNLNVSHWNTNQLVKLFIHLPFEQVTWDILEKYLKKDQLKYWTRIMPNPFLTNSSLNPAIKELLKCNRPKLAINCIYAEYQKSKQIDIELTVEALKLNLDSKENEYNSYYYYQELIAQLQENTATNTAELILIEWNYLPLLDEFSTTSPKTLERKLSAEPAFFLEIISYAYKSKPELTSPIGDKKIDSYDLNVAENAYRLLRVWKIPPGQLENGNFSANLLDKWFREVKTLSINKGYYEVAMTHVGQILFYLGKESPNLWLKKKAIELLNEKDNDNIRNGYTTEVYNSRGVHVVDPSGQPELKIADLWASRADKAEELGLIRIATALKELSNTYIRESERVKQQTQYD